MNPIGRQDVLAKQPDRGLRDDEGMATLLISSDLPEVLAMSDRILVMQAGRIAGELSRDEATQEKVLGLAIPAATGIEGAAA